MNDKPVHAPMRSVSEALQLILQDIQSIPEIEIIETLAANHRVLAKDQIAQLSVPPLDNSQMDGYAVCAADCKTELIELPISQRIAAGQVPVALQPGTAARIFTGALIPRGADAVVMQENCTIDGERVRLHQVPQPGQAIRRAGEDIQIGSTILKNGARLRAQELGLAASVGLATLPVTRCPRIAVFYTGDELVMPGELLKPGRIYNSNRFILHSLLRNLGCTVTDYGNIPDRLDATQAVLQEAAQEHDLIVTSGGVSVGEEDYIKPALQAVGQMNLWQIAMKPGKPLAFGRVYRANSFLSRSSYFLGLPGNPVSSFVTFLLFARPLILRLQGIQDVAPKSFLMRADFDWLKPDRRNEFLRAKINPDGGLDLFPNQGSAVLTSAVWGDGLIDNPPENVIRHGAMVRFLPFTELLHG